MPQRTIVGAIIGVAILACGFVVWKVNTPKPRATETPAEQTISTVDKAALAQLQNDPQSASSSVPYRIATFEPVDYTGWRTYHDKTFGFTVAYPPSSFTSTSEDLKAMDPDADITSYAMATAFIVCDKRDASGACADQILSITVDKQPLGPSMPVYANIRDLYASDADYFLTRKHSPAAELVSLNGYEALFIASDNVDAPRGAPKHLETYYLVHDNRLFTIEIIKDKMPHYTYGILQSIRFDQ